MTRRLALSRSGTGDQVAGAFVLGGYVLGVNGVVGVGVLDERGVLSHLFWARRLAVYSRTGQ